MKTGKIRLFAVLLVIAMMASFIVAPSVAAEETTGDSNTSSVVGSQTGTESSSEYVKYLEMISGKDNAKEDIIINAVDYLNAEGNTFDVVAEDGTTVKGDVLSKKLYDVLLSEITGERVSKDCLVWADNNRFQQQGTVTYQFTVPADAVYNLAFTYFPLDKTGYNNDAEDDKSSTTNVEVSVSFDGESLYAGLKGLKLPRKFTNNGAVITKPAGEIRTDSLGNQLTPEQVQYGEFVTEYAMDPIGVISDPYCVFLTAGTHTITLESVYEPFALAEIILKAPVNTPSYQEYLAANTSAANYTGKAIEVEGEDAFIKSSNSLVSKADNSSSHIKPYNHIKNILNYIGSTNWQAPGDTLTWVIDVPESGLYKLGVNYKQANVIDGFSYRSLAIDGVIPFEECKSIAFDYCTSWTFYEFGTGGKNNEPYLFYLPAGKHILSLTVTLGETAEFYNRLSDIVNLIGDTYIDIVMITSDSPDPNRDYDLFKQIPNFQEKLNQMHQSLTALANDMSVLSGDRSSNYISALKNMARVVKNMYDNPFTAQVYLSDFYNNYTTVCSWLYEMKVMPLSVDQFQFAAPEKEFTDNYAGFFEGIVFEIKRFFVSFSKAFSRIGGTVGAEGAGSVRIWVNWGRDQTQVLSNLIQDSFTYETGIGVELEIVDASVIKGILAGNFPDLQLHLSRTDPVNLGMRGALYDLTNFSNAKDPKYSLIDDRKSTAKDKYLLDYEVVLKRFHESADVPYWYEGDKLFAIPDTQNFFIMFYRTDIFDNLGLEHPDKANNGLGWTWDDYLNATTILQRNNMKSYIPYTKIASSTIVNSGMGSLNLFPTMITQNNVQLYNDEQTATNLTTGEAIAAFTQWTDFYTKYGIEKQADFYNRFRVGTMPLGISAYTLYTQLNQAAPEIQGRWSIAEIPGIMQEDGTINRSIAGSGTGCGIIAPSKNKDLAWQFLCWWTAADTQLRYNNNVESILGTVARTATANVEAFSAYSWNANDLVILQSQWAEVEELAELPGGYYVARAVDQAYWEVLNGESNEKDALIKWGNVADNEIIRKINEYK